MAVSVRVKCLEVTVNASALVLETVICQFAAPALAYLVGHD